MTGRKHGRRKARARWVLLAWWVFFLALTIGGLGYFATLDPH